MRSVSFFTILIILFSCSDKGNKAQEIIDAAIEAHGGQNYSSRLVTFTFRDKEYSVSRDAATFTYTRSFEDDSLGSVKDVLINSADFYRIVNDDTIALSDEWKRRYSNSVNAVLYFMQLPYLLNDPAARKTYLQEDSIEGEPYHVVKVTFMSEGGGEDFEDEYMYWIHQKTHTVDYLAYNYQTDGGGVRFRKAYNRQKVGSILFQDYINYEVPVGTALEDIPELYEQDKLKELSRIENTAIKVEDL